MEIGIGRFLLLGTKVLRKRQIHSKQVLRHLIIISRSVRQVLQPWCGKLQLQVPQNSGSPKIAIPSWLHFILKIDRSTRRPLEGQLPGGFGWKQFRRLSDGLGAIHQAPVRHTGACDGQHTCHDGQHSRCCAKSEKEEKEERLGNTGGAPRFPAATSGSTEGDV